MIKGDGVISKTILQKYIELAKEGTSESIARIMADLILETPIVETKFIDFALSYVTSEEGPAVMEKYLFKGSQI